MGKILIVDDVYSELQLFENALIPLGHEIITAMNGEEAEDKVKTENPDLIILDVIMPKKNGFQVCRDIKSNDKYKHIPIIIVTSKDQESDKFWGKKQGAEEYLIKPFDTKLLVRLAQKYLKT